MLDFKRAFASAKVPERGKLRELKTCWGADLNTESILPEHPRPTMARKAYTMLNGRWEYAFVPLDLQRKEKVPALGAEEARRTVEHAVPPEHFDGTILVPFSPEAPLSGVNRVLQPHELLWYRRELAAPDLSACERLILHFETVDWTCAVFVNGQLAGSHAGGYLPFDLDITPFLNSDGKAGDGDAELTVCVYDPTDAGTQPRGKQSLHPGGIWYTGQSGIWGSVWYEIVPAAHLCRLSLNGDATGTLHIKASVRGSLGPDASLEITLFDEDVTAGSCTLPLAAADGSSSVTESAGSLPISCPHLWSPDDPFLYRVEAVLHPGTGANSVAPCKPDVVEGYAAFRTVGIERTQDGHARFFLNGKPLFLRGLLDQGYWSDGLMTAPSDEALVHDIEAARASGFNMLRKHIKIEAARWYYHCDRLGMLVWQDVPSGGGTYNIWHTNRKATLFQATWGRFRDDTPAHRRAISSSDEGYRREWTETCDDMVRLLGAHPSIVTWVLFNEAWGQFDALAAAERVHSLDPTRPIDAVSGWDDQHCGDYLSDHNYFCPITVPRDGRKLVGYVASRGCRASVVSEFGGLARKVEDHTVNDAVYGYSDYPSLAAWREALRDLLERTDALEDEGLAGFVYTQLSDVEDEVNGILTYDRRVNKLRS